MENIKEFFESDIFWGLLFSSIVALMGLFVAWIKNKVKDYGRLNQKRYKKRRKLYGKEPIKTVNKKYIRKTRKTYAGKYTYLGYYYLKRTLF